MTVLNKKYVLCGLKNHAFTTLNIQNKFKQKGMTWQQGNDWVQVVPNHDHSAFYRVWHRTNMTMAKVGTTWSSTGPSPRNSEERPSTNQSSSSAQYEEIDFDWQTDHLVVKDMYLLGDISEHQALFYSYSDR